MEPITNRYLRDIPLPGLDDGPSGYRGPAVCRMVGITYRQLDYWTTTGLVTPSVRGAEGSGSQRLYAFSDIVQLKVIKQLLDTGITLQRIRAALEFVRDRGLDLRNITLLSDGAQVYALDDQREIIDLIQRGQGVFAIAIEPLLEQLEAAVTKLPAERAVPTAPRSEGPGDAFATIPETPETPTTTPTPTTTRGTVPEQAPGAGRRGGEALAT